MSSPYTGAISLFDDAEFAAKRAASRWIRAALRETFLQGMNQAWVVEENSDGEYSVSVSKEGFEECISLVKSVSDAWRAKLVEAHHERVAGWVKEVFQLGKSTLWDSVATSSAISPTREIVVSNQQNQNSDDNPNNEDESLDMIPYCKLKRLGRKTSLDEKLPENALQVFQTMGEKRESYWPLDWKLIEEATQKLPKRRQLAKKYPTTTDAISIRDASMIPPAKRLKCNETGRPPSNLSSIASSTVVLSKQEQGYLDRLINPDTSPADGQEERNNPCNLFGPLQKVGQLHFSKRLELNEQSWTEKQIRCQRNAAVKERLLPNKMAGSNDLRGRYRSKVLRALSPATAEQPKHYFNLDVGWTMMELLDAKDNDINRDDNEPTRRRLCAFSSVEMKLLDEDTSEESDVATVD
jgi:hypothetical protein